MPTRDSTDPPTAELLERLQSELADPSTLRKVYAFTWRRLRVLSKFGRPADRSEVEELVNQAIVDTADGVLSWDPARVRLSTHLCGAIRSRTWKATTRAPAARLEPLPDQDETQHDNLSDPETPEDSAIARAREAEDMVLVAKVQVHLHKLAEERGDDALGLLLLAYEEGKVGRTDIAEATGLTVDDVTNGRKRLARLLRELPPELAREVEQRLKSTK